jgi:diguanylate cyclase (GGDEF)-like protein
MIHLFRSSQSLAQVLVWPYVILILVLSLLVGWLSYNAGHQGVLNVADRMLQETSERVALKINRHIYGAGAVLEAAFPTGMTAGSSIDDDLEKIKSRFWIATSLHLDPHNYVYYGNAAGEFAGLFRHSVTDAELRVKYSTDQFRSAYRFDHIDSDLGEAVNVKTDYDPRQRPWFQMGQTHVDDQWSDTYLNFWEKDLVITRLRQVLSKEGTFQGVVATDVSLTALSDFIKNIHVTPHSVVFVIEQDGDLIASSQGEIIGTDKDGQAKRHNAMDSENAFIRGAYVALKSQIALSPFSGTEQRMFSFTDQNNEQVYGAYAWVQDSAGLSWITVVAVPSSDFMGSLNDNARWTVLIGGIGIVLALLIGLSIVNWVVRDVRRLSKAATRIGKGQMNVRLSIERSDEIGQLATNFLDMQKELSTDKLTGVTSRAALIRYLDALALHGKTFASDPASVFTVMFLDLNRFKAINDTLGHQFGDLTLIEVGERLRQVVREEDIIARYGGDEFVIVFVGVADAQFTETIKSEIADILSTPLKCLQSLPNASHMTVGAAIGAAYFPADGQDSETLLKLADHAMYENKSATTGHR